MSFKLLFAQNSSSSINTISVLLSLPLYAAEGTKSVPTEILCTFGKKISNLNCHFLSSWIQIC